MYEGGKGVPQDYAEAVKWCRKAADQGYSAAQFNLGTAYANGQGVPRDDAEAKWYRKAADQGLAEAQFNVGEMYRKRRGVLLAGKIAQLDAEPAPTGSVTFTNTIGKVRAIRCKG